MASAFVTQVTLTPNRSATLTAVNAAISAAQTTVTVQPGYIGITADSDTVITISAVDNDGSFSSTVFAIIIDNNDLKTGGTGLQATLALTGATSKELHQVINSPFGYSIGIVELEYNTGGAGINNKFYLLTNNQPDRTAVIPGFPATFSYDGGGVIVAPGFVIAAVDLAAVPYAGVPPGQNGYYLTLRLNQTFPNAPSAGIPGPNTTFEITIGAPVPNQSIIERFTFALTPDNQSMMIPASWDFWVDLTSFIITFTQVGNLGLPGLLGITFTPTIQVNGYLSAS